MRLSAKRAWLPFLCAVVAIHLSTATISPTIWMDEVQIIEFGRQTYLGADRGWSFNWLAGGARVPLLGIVGPLLQEESIRLFGPEPLWPRISALLGACVAASLLVMWLRARGLQSEWWAFALGVCFLLDPMFVSGYRGARVDSWTFACVFASCCLVRWAVLHRSIGAAVLAGLFCALAWFIWPAALFSSAVLPVEAWLATRGVPATQRIGERVRIASGLACGVLGGLIAGALAVTWLEPGIGRALDFMTHSQFHTVRPSLTELAAGIFDTLKLNPLFWAATLVAASVSAPLAVLPLALGALVTLATSVYVHRVVYLIPGALLVIAEALERPSAATRKVLKPALLATAAFCVVVSLGVRPVLALRGAKARDAALISDFARVAIGPGHYRVYVEPWEFYYAGRQLKWAMFHAFPGPGQAEYNRKLLAAQTDFTIVRAEDVAQVAAWQLDLEMQALSLEIPAQWVVGAHYGRYAVFRNRARAKPAAEPNHPLDERSPRPL